MKKSECMDIESLLELIATETEKKSKMIDYEKRGTNHYVFCKKEETLNVPTYHSYDVTVYPNVIIIKVENLRGNFCTIRTNRIYKYKDEFLIVTRNGYIEKMVINKQDCHKSDESVKKRTKIVSLPEKKIKLANLVISKEE